MHRSMLEWILYIGTSPRILAAMSRVTLGTVGYIPSGCDGHSFFGCGRSTY